MHFPSAFISRSFLIPVSLLLVAGLNSKTLYCQNPVKPPPGKTENRDFVLEMQRLENKSLELSVYLDSARMKTLIPEQQIQLPEEKKVIRIVAVGDIMPGTDFPNESYLPASCARLFDPVRDIISSADLAFGNLEGVFSSQSGNAKNCRDPKTCYVFRMPDSYAGCIQDAGFDVLGVANNHVNDFGLQGRLNTARRLDEAGIPFAGFPDRPWAILEVKGLKIGFCAFAPHSGTLDMKDYKGAAVIISRLKSQTDLVIVSFHGGAEGSDHQHVADRDEEFLGYNRGNVVKFARMAVDAGADVVVGHGPHVVRAMENYKSRLIAYSLGNFCTYSRFNLSGPNAYAPLLELELQENGEYISARIHSFYQPGEGGPVPDPHGRAHERIRELSRSDFPGQNLSILDNGEIIFVPQK